MRTRTLIILLIILALLGGAAALITRLKSEDGSKGNMGRLLLEKLPANKIESINIQGADSAVSLVKDEDRWVVENRFNYPADFSKVIDIVRKLKEVKIGRSFQSSEKTLKRLSLKDPDDPEALKEEKGARIRLKDKKETLLASILIGKTRKAGAERSYPAGQYVRLGQESMIYLIDTDFAFLQKEPSAWLDKSLVDIQANEVQKISCLSADGKKVRYAFERPEKQKDLEPLNLPAKKKVNKSALNRLAGALSSLRTEDIVKPSDLAESAGMKRSARLEYLLFSGMIYRVYPGKASSEGGRGHLQLEVDYQETAPEKKEISEDASSNKEKQEASPEKTPEELSLEAKQLNERLSPWVYVIPKWQHAAFITDLNQLLEKPDK